MKKLTMVAAIAALTAASHGFAATYNMTGNATTVNVDSSGTVTLNYTAPNSSPAISGTWDVDTGTGGFSGNVFQGDYTTLTNVSLGIFGSMSGSVSYEGANHDLTAGTGSLSGTTFTYNVATGGSNSNAASSYSNTNASCSGSGSVAGNTVCGTWGGTTGAWEGVTITLDFSPDFSSFTGSIAAVEKSGSGLTANTTTINYTVAGVLDAPAEVPVPAAAWLFGSALVGLAGVGRKRKIA